MQRRSVLATVGVLVIGATLAAPLAGGAAAIGASCYTADGATEYFFKGALEVVPEHETAFAIERYAVEFEGIDPTNEAAVPLEDAHNDVNVELLDDTSRETLFAHHSPDTIDYFTPFSETLENWVVVQNRIVQGRFTAAFDKRGKPDAHCQAVTHPFTMSGTQANGDLEFICNKAGSACEDITP